MNRISVIIPTHNRAAGLPRTLDALAAQTLAVQDYEVIVVADGCSDTTVDLLRSFRAPYKLTFYELPGRGAAAARNIGAAHATGDLLLFLDDDMEASGSLLSAHLNAHRKEPGRVVLGYFPMQPPAPQDDPFTKAARLWWAENFDARRHPGYRFTLKDFCTGNVSLSRSLFEDAGKFDERIDQRGAGEDYEFGYRLLQQGAKFHFAPAAASIHHTLCPLPISLRRAEQEGYGQTVLVQRHPELFWEFNVSRLSRLAHSTVLRPLWRALWAVPQLAAIPAGALRLLVSILANVTAYSLLWRFYPILRGYAYWRGVRAAAGSLASWERLYQDTPLEPRDVSEIDLDLVHDLENLDTLMSESAADAVRVWCDGEPVGRIPPWPGAEPLRAEHVRKLLVERFAGVLLGVLIQRSTASATSSGYSTPAIPALMAMERSNISGAVQRS